MFELVDGSDHEWEAYQYLRLLPKEIRNSVTFEQFLVIRSLVCRWNEFVEGKVLPDPSSDE